MGKFHDLVDAGTIKHDDVDAIISVMMDAVTVISHAELMADAIDADVRRGTLRDLSRAFRKATRGEL